MHEQNFIHRDLKPENILVKRHENGHKWEAVIADFGTSRLVGTDAHTKIKMSGANPFSIAFAAPEQILASKLGLKNVDLWSVGIIIYRIIIGELPFTPDAADTTFIKLSKKITSGELPSKVHQLPEPYKSMVLTCLKVNIEQRVQTAQELINLLEIVVVPHPPFNAHLLAQIGAFYGFVLSVLFGVLQTYFLHSVNLLTATPWEIKLIPNVISQFIYFSIPIFLSITFYHFYTSNKRQLHFSEGFWMGLLMLSIFGLGCYIICDINYRSLVEQCSLNSSIPKFRQIKDNLWNDWRNAPMLLFKYCKWGGIWLIVLLGLVFGLNNWRTTQ